MNKRKKRRMGMIILACVLLLGIALYQPMIHYLSGQAANPEGFIGNVMTRIWSNYFENQSRWGLSLVRLEKKSTILSVGFGSGSGIKIMKESYPSSTVYGVDISEEALKTATEINQASIHANEVILSLDDVARLPYKDHFFDLIVAGQTHIYWEELERGLSECYRTLKEDGTFLITCETDKIDYHLPAYRDTNKFITLLQSLGFSNVNVKTTGNIIAFVCTK